MKTLLGAALVSILMACGGGGGKADKGVKLYEKCAACADEACAKGVAKEVAAFQDSLSMDDLGDMMKAEAKMDAATKKCTDKYADFTIWTLDSLKK